MEPKQKLIVAAVGGICAVIILALAGLLVAQIGKMNTARTERNDAESNLTDYYNSKPYPSETNREIREADAKAYTATADAARGLFAHGLKVPQGETPSQFVTRIGESIRTLNARQAEGRRILAGISGSKSTAEEAPLDYAFGRYVVQGEMPAAAQVPRLAAQFAAIEHVCAILLDKGANAITGVERIPFDSAAAAAEEEPRSSRRSRRSRREETAKPAAMSAEMDPVLSEDGVTRESYTITFRARYTTLASVLNALTVDPLFVVVTDLSLTRPSSLRDRVAEMVKKRQSVKAAALRRAANSRSEEEREAAQAAADKPLFAGASPAERLVTDPANSVPLEVILKFDVYSVPPVEPAAEPDAEKEGK